MVGALTLASSTRRRRYRYAEGGDVGDDPGSDVYNYATTSDSAASAPPQSDEQRGALGDAAQNGDAENAIDRGTRNLGAQVRQQQVNSILAAGGQQPSPMFQVPPSNVVTDPSRAPGATNIPMLAAAGAFLKPTHSGGFSEALGNAFSAAVPEIDKQRQLAETAQLRKAQMDQTGAIWGGRLGIQGDRAETYRQSVAGRLAVQNRVADLKAAGLSETEAWHQATLELNAHKLDALVTHYESQDIAKERSGDQRDRSLDQGDTRLQQGSEKIELAKTRIQNTQDYHDAQLRLRATLGDNSNSNAVLARATTLSASTGQPLSKSVDQVLSQMGRTRNAVPAISVPTPQRQSAAPAAPAPGGGGGLVDQARAAIAQGAPRDAVIAKLKEMGGDLSGL